MRVCGVEIKASDAIVVVLDGTKEDFEIIKTDVQKINLKDTNSSKSVQDFQNTFNSFLEDNNIDKVNVKKRNTKGQFSGGAVSFKIEGIIQLTKKSSVTLVTAASIASAIKKEQPPLADKLFGYQKGAYETAYTSL